MGTKLKNATPRIRARSQPLERTAGISCAHSERPERAQGMDRPQDGAKLKNATPRPGHARNLFLSGTTDRDDQEMIETYTGERLDCGGDDHQE